MKQLYGYNQDTDKGNNALNFVANYSCDSTMPADSTFNYLGSYRFEIQYTEPAGFKAGDKARPLVTNEKRDTPFEALCTASRNADSASTNG